MYWDLPNRNGSSKINWDRQKLLEYQDRQDNWDQLLWDSSGLSRDQPNGQRIVKINWDQLLWDSSGLSRDQPNWNKRRWIV